MRESIANIDFAYSEDDVQLQAVLNMTSRGSAGMLKLAQESQSIPAERSRSLVWGLPI